MPHPSSISGMDSHLSSSSVFASPASQGSFYTPESTSGAMTSGSMGRSNECWFNSTGLLWLFVVIATTMMVFINSN